MLFRRKAQASPGQMDRRVPFPFKEGFPRELGVVVMLSVAEGREPARVVFHYSDNSWAVADGVNDPNEPGAAIAKHMWHLVEADPSLAELASLGLGQAAVRADQDSPWYLRDADYEPETGP